MPKLQKRTITKGGKPSTSYLITLPKDLVESMGWEAGDYLNLSPSDKYDMLIKNVDYRRRKED